jgi:hypothetical protein
MIRQGVRLEWIVLLSLLLSGACSSQALYAQETYDAAARTATRAAANLATALAGQSAQVTAAWTTSQPIVMQIDYEDKGAEDTALIVAATGLMVIAAFTVILLTLVWVFLDHRKRVTQRFRSAVREAQMMRPPPADEE